MSLSAFELETMTALLDTIYDPEAAPARRIEAAELWLSLMPDEEPGARRLREDRRRKGAATSADEALADLDAFLGLDEPRVAGLLACALEGAPEKLRPWECSPPPGWTPSAPSTLAP